MGLIVQRVPWTRQPPYPVRLDQSNPIARKMKLVALPGITGARNLTQGFIPDESALTRVVAPTKIGLAHKFSRSPHNYLSDDSLAALITKDSGAFGVLCVPDDVTSSQQIFMSMRDGAVGHRYYLQNQSGALTFSWASGYSLTTTAPTFEIGKPVFPILSWNAANSCTCYSDGLPVGTSVLTNNANPTLAAVGVLANSLTTAWTLNGQVLLYFVASYLTEPEVAALSANPWRIFAP